MQAQSVCVSARLLLCIRYTGEMAAVLHKPIPHKNQQLPCQVIYKRVYVLETD